MSIFSLLGACFLLFISYCSFAAVVVSALQSSPAKTSVDLLNQCLVVLCVLALDNAANRARLGGVGACVGENTLGLKGEGPDK